MRDHYFLDCDGVLAHRGRIQPSVRRILGGIKWSPVTARGLYRTLDVLDGLQPSGPAIMCNGSLIANLPDEIIHRQTLASEVPAKLESVLQQQEVQYALFSVDDGPHYLAYARDDAAVAEVHEEMKHRVSGVTCQPDKFIGWARECPPTKITLRTSGNISCPADIHHQRNDGWVDIGPGDTKATGILRVVERLRINLDRVVVVGNDYNDVSMFQLSGIARRIAVGSGCPRELRALADHYVPFFEALFD